MNYGAFDEGANKSPTGFESRGFMRECKRCVDCGIRWKQPRKSRCTRCDRISRGLSPDGRAGRYRVDDTTARIERKIARHLRKLRKQRWHEEMQPLQVEPIGQRVINGMEFDVVFDGSVR